MMNLKKSLSFAAMAVSAALAEKQQAEKVHILLYETNVDESNNALSVSSLFKESGDASGIQVSLFGQDTKFEGFGSKYVQVLPVLEAMHPKTLAVISDGRDVVLNVPSKNEAKDAIDRFSDSFLRLTKDKPNSIVVSAEPQCCVSALCHAKPGEYFEPVTGNRLKRACNSGQTTCLWEDNENISFWDEFMTNHAYSSQAYQGDYKYLNAGLIVGYPRNLLRLIESLQLEEDEDDQAILTGLMYHDPSAVILDYAQEMFGNARWTLGTEGCLSVFEKNNHNLIKNKETETTPLIIHFSGKYFDCMDMVFASQGTMNNQKVVRHLQEGNDPIPSNYGNYGHHEKVKNFVKSFIHWLINLLP